MARIATGAGVELTPSLTVDQVLTTTRTVRKRLDLERPVEREVIEECLELALQAPTGSNAQGWHFVFVEDAEKKKAIGDIYLTNARGYLASPSPEYAEGDTRGERMGKVRDSATYLAEHMHDAPVLMIPCIEGREDKTPLGGVSFWASLFPAVWSFCLALRSRGLGSCWTTLHLLRDGEKQAAEVLGIPYDNYSQGGLFPIAYTKGTDFRRAKRLPAEQLTHWNTW
jgi:nitroreductase